jgi:hypothetical protein
MGNAPGQPKRTVFDGRVYLSRLALAEALGRSTRTVVRLEKRGVLCPLRGLDGHVDQRWYAEDEVEQLGRIAEEVGFFDGRGSFTVFCDAVQEWRKQASTDAAASHTEELPRELPFRVRRNLRQFQAEEDEQNEWSPEERSPTLVPACPECGGGLGYVTDQLQRQTAVCPLHGRVKPVMVPPPAQDGTRWGHKYSVAPWTPPERQHHQRRRGERLTEQNSPWAVRRAPNPSVPARPTYLDPFPGPTKPS